MRPFRLNFSPSEHIAREKAEKALSELRTLEEQYVPFAKSMRISSERARRDFATLCRLPGVKKLAFVKQLGKAQELLIGTEHVYLCDQDGLQHDIGTFIISIRRFPETHYRFENLTPLRVGHWKYHHPHIGEPGIICMSEGFQQLNIAVSEGNIPTAVRVMWNALNSLGPGAPYGGAAIENWPLRR